MEIHAIIEQLPEAANACPDLVRVGRCCDVEFLLEIGEQAFQIEEADAGIPLVRLHTAGAHSSQYRHLMCDPRVTNRPTPT